jgi:hypothetical protein
VVVRVKPVEKVASNICAVKVESACAIAFMETAVTVLWTTLTENTIGEIVFLILSILMLTFINPPATLELITLPSVDNPLTMLAPTYTKLTGNLRMITLNGGRTALVVKVNLYTE